jgi:DNA-binding winged helix-turn-helix (wHTH) protein
VPLSQAGHPAPFPICFGAFELDVEAGELRRDGRRVKLQPQPFRLLRLLASRPGHLVTRDDIRRELWPDGTFVDFDQAVNFAIRQIRDALRDSADSPLYVETVPKRGYRFIAPIRGMPLPPSRSGRLPGETTVRLHKALWANIAEMRLREQRHRRYAVVALGVLAAVVLLAAIVFVLRPGLHL